MLLMYEPPSTIDLINSSTVHQAKNSGNKRTINEAWTELLHEEARNKTTVEYVNVGACKLSQMHMIWQNQSTINPEGHSESSAPRQEIPACHMSHLWDKRKRDLAAM